MASLLHEWINRLPPGHPLVRRAGEVVEAGQLRRQAAAVAEALRGHGSAGPVLLFCEDAGHFLAGLLGALAAGRDVLLPGHLAPDYLAEIRRPGMMVLADGPGGDLLLDGREGAGDLAPGDGSVSFFTSGSTGTPKLVTKRQEQLTAEVEVLARLWGSPAGTVVGTVSHQHIYGLLFRVLWPLATAGTIHGPRIDNWEGLIPLLGPGCVLVSSPAHLTRLPQALPGLIPPDRVFSSGAPLPTPAAAALATRLGLLPTEVLGSTETGGIAWRLQTSDEAPWQPFPVVALRIAGEAGEEQPGLLEVQSPFTGVPGFMPVGDRARFLGDGSFVLAGRADRIVKIEGKRVSLPRVEQSLQALPGVTAAAAVDLLASKGALAAVIVLDQAGQGELATLGPFRYSRQLRQHLASRLEPMERPKFWRFVDRLPETAQGKRTQAALRALFESHDRPPVLAREIATDRASFELDVTVSLRWFDGHFPSRAILPGVAQIHLAAAFAAEAWGVVFVGTEMSRIKFRRTIEPPARVTLTLSRPRPDSLNFEYRCDGEIASSGTLRGTA